MCADFAVNSPESFGLFLGDEGYEEFDANFPQSQKMPETYADDTQAFGSKATFNGDTVIASESSGE